MTSSPEKNLQDLVVKFAIAQSILGDTDETVRLAKLIHSDNKEANNLQIVYVLAQAEIDDSKLAEARELIDDAAPAKFPNDTALILMKIELSDESDAKKFDQKKLVLEQQTDLYTRSHATGGTRAPIGRQSRRRRRIFAAGPGTAQARQ